MTLLIAIEVTDFIRHFKMQMHTNDASALTDYIINTRNKLFVKNAKQRQN